jgi:hypothetical protein
LMHFLLRRKNGSVAKLLMLCDNVQNLSRLAA